MDEINGNEKRLALHIGFTNLYEQKINTWPSVALDLMRSYQDKWFGMSWWLYVVEIGEYDK